MWDSRAERPLVSGFWASRSGDAAYPSYVIRCLYPLIAPRPPPLVVHVLTYDVLGPLDL